MLLAVKANLGSLQAYLDLLPLKKRDELNFQLVAIKSHLAKPRRVALEAEHRLSLSAWKEACIELGALPAVRDEISVKTAIAKALQNRALHGPPITVAPPPRILGRVVKKVRIEAARLKIGLPCLPGGARVRVPKSVATPPVITANEDEWIIIIQRYDSDCVGREMLFRPPVWATFSEADPSADPFSRIRSPTRLNEILALGWTWAEIRGGALLITYSAEDKPLHFPTIADAVWLDKSGFGGWHAYFFPSAMHEKCGRSLPTGSAKYMQGKPEVVHGRLPSNRAFKVRSIEP